MVKLLVNVQMIELSEEDMVDTDTDTDTDTK